MPGFRSLPASRCHWASSIQAGAPLGGSCPKDDGDTLVLRLLFLFCLYLQPFLRVVLATVVESLPIRLDDNITLPVVPSLLYLIQRYYKNGLSDKSGSVRKALWCWRLQKSNSGGYILSIWIKKAFDQFPLSKPQQIRSLLCTHGSYMYTAIK